MWQPMIRAMTTADFDSIVHLNQNALDGVGPLDADGLAQLVTMSDQALVDVDGDIAGFVITLPPGAAYESSCYRWFEDRLEDYVYLDRIVVAGGHRREGVASRLYEQVERELPIALEVYEDNDVSLAFHESRGFEQVGVLTDGGTTNLMLVREPVDA